MVAAAQDLAQGTVELAVVDPDELRREGLATIAERSSRIEVVATASSVQELPQLRACAVAAVALPRGVWSGPKGLSVPTLVFRDSVTDAELLNAFRVGAAGVLKTPCTTADLQHAVVSMAGGGTYVDPRLAGRLVVAAFRGQPGEGVYRLTAQERRVLALLPRQLSNREIGKELGLSHETVKSHLRNAYAKLGVNDRRQAARIVREQGIGTF